MNFWKDKQYTTDFEVLHKPADVKKLKFDEEFMLDYDEETGLQDNDIISYLSIFYAKADTKVGESKHNDFLYECLIQCFTYKLPPLLRSPEEFWQQLRKVRILLQVIVAPWPRPSYNFFL